MNEKDFNHETMTMATDDDVYRMYLRLWGASYKFYMEFEDKERLDSLQVLSVVINDN